MFIDHPPANMVVSTGFAVLTPTAVGSAYLHLWLTSDEFVDYLVANADGSAYPAVRADRFEAAAMLVPSSATSEAFERQALPLFRKRASNDRESRTLSELRDTLLPKLLSGEVRVREAEQAVRVAGL